MQIRDWFLKQYLPAQLCGQKMSRATYNELLASIYTLLQAKQMNDETLVGGDDENARALSSGFVGLEAHELLGDNDKALCGVRIRWFADGVLVEFWWGHLGCFFKHSGGRWEIV